MEILIVALILMSFGGAIVLYGTAIVISIMIGLVSVIFYLFVGFLYAIAAVILWPFHFTWKKLIKSWDKTFSRLRK